MNKQEAEKLKEKFWPTHAECKCPQCQMTIDLMQEIDEMTEGPKPHIWKIGEWAYWQYEEQSHPFQIITIHYGTFGKIGLSETESIGTMYDADNCIPITAPKFKIGKVLELCDNIDGIVNDIPALATDYDEALNKISELIQAIRAEVSASPDPPDSGKEE